MYTIIKEKIKNRIKRYRIQYFVNNLRKSTLNKIESDSQNPRIYYFLTPTHSNLGDQAQLLCWQKLFAKWYKNYDIIEIPSIIGTDKVFSAIIKKINQHDLIYIHSGYLVCDLYANWKMICRVVDTFKQFKITILPQTIHFIDNSIQEMVSHSFKSHGNIHLICRDKVSYSKAQQIFRNIELSVLPDVVTTLIGTNYIPEYRKRNGVLLCVRHDAEKLYSDEQINELKDRLNGINVDISDTTTNANIWEWSNNREDIIQDYLKTFSKFQVIVTDRYHGTIFSQIVNTPVIVLSSSDHKLKSGVDWFPKEIFGKNLMYAQNLENAYNYINEILSRKGAIIMNPPYFLNTYYNKNL